MFLIFLYTSATCEVITPGTSSVAHLYQKTNTSLLAEFLEKLDEAGYYLIDDLEEVRETLPVVYNFMKPNKNQVCSQLRKKEVIAIYLQRDSWAQ